MFGMQHSFKRIAVGIAIAALVAAFAGRTACASTLRTDRVDSVGVPVRIVDTGNPGVATTFITDTLGGNGQPKSTDVVDRAVAIHQASQVRAEKAHAQQSQGVTLITDTLGGNGQPKTDVFERSVAIHEAQQAMSQARAIAQGYVSPVPYVNGGMSAKVAESFQAHHYDPAAYVNGGASPQVAKAIEDRGFGRTVTPSVTGGSNGTSSFNWGDAGLGAGLAAGLLLLLLGGNKLRGNRRSVLTA